MDQAEINTAIKKVWTDKLRQKEESLTDSILKGYTKWVQNLVKQSAEQQAQKQQAQQSQPVQSQDAEQQGGAA